MDSVEKFEAKLASDIAREVKEAREQKPLLEGLLGNANWGILERVLLLQIEWRIGEILASPLGGNKTLAVQEFMKGEVAGLKLALAMPKLMLEEVTRIVESTEENPDDDGPDAAADSVPAERSTEPRDFDPSADFPTE